jgi:putative solute:sodium symporter small subunit
MSGRPARERVTSVDRVPTRAEPSARTGSTRVSEAETLFTRGLMRAQGRLALSFVLAFVAVVAGVTFVISRVPSLHDVVVWGVPLPWLVQAYGYYPIIVVFAAAYAIAAVRVERRFRDLVEHE